MNLKRLLKISLLDNAALCVACGLPGAIAPSWLATVMGLEYPGALRTVGIVLLLNAVAITINAVKQAPSHALVWSTIAGDILWVVFTVWVLAANSSSMTAFGVGLVSGTTALVFGLATAQALSMVCVTHEGEARA